mgnify:CR=1 FL=1
MSAITDTDRYLWLRDRMAIHYQQPLSGGAVRPTLMIRLGHEFLDSNKDPSEGWLDVKYFNQVKTSLDAAIDTAIMKGRGLN